jgi:hypothetical protein
MCKRFAGNRDRKEVVRMKRIILVFTAALLLAAMIVAVAPAMAQEEKKKEEEKKEEKGKEEEKDKKEEEKKEEKDLPKSGGVPINASLLGLGAGVLLVGGGLVAIRSARRDRS